MLAAATLSSTGGGNGDNFSAHVEDGALGNQGVVNAIDGSCNSGYSGDSSCSATELTGGGRTSALIMLVAKLLAPLGRLERKEETLPCWCEQEVIFGLF